jgi:transposase
MDVHKDFTVVDMFDRTAPKKDQHRTQRVPTTKAGLVSILKPLKGRCRIAVEVGTQIQWVVSVVRPLAAEVQVANPSQIPWLFRSGKKNDRIDARKLSILLSLNQLPTVHLPSADVSAWRMLINHRRTLVRRRTSLKNQVRSVIRTFNYRCPHRSLWTRAGLAWLRSLAFDDARRLMIDCLLEQLELVQCQLTTVEKQLDAIASTQSGVRLLRTIPGVGPRTAEAVIAFADDISRFKNKKQFASYFGVTPKLDASGGFIRHGHISKRGPSVVRWVLVEAAHQITRRCPAMRQFLERAMRGSKGRYKKGIVASARKTLTIMFAMLRDGTEFDHSRVCPAVA